MGEEGDAFYVVRKGDIIGIYKNLSDCQNQAGSSVCSPSVSVFKGHGLPEAEEYLASHGLKNALYTINASDVKEDLFGKLDACTYQQQDSSVVKSPVKISPPKRSQEMAGSTAFPISQTQRKHFKPDNRMETPEIPLSSDSCTLEFDGASKGNPGQSGAGAVLRADDGSAVYRLREGVGIATNNVAEYRAVILGLKYALEKGYKHICVKGDSKLVCMQVQGLWKTKNPNMADLCQVAKGLKEKFTSFDISHVLREFNSEADVQANRALNLRDGQVEVDWNGK